jgi:hypothetical protein
MSDPRKFKNDIVVEGDIQLPAETANRALIVDGAGEIASSAVTSTELALLSGATTNLSDVAQDVADLVTLSGVPANSTDLGTFTGTLIPDGSDIKEALQALETEIEAIPSPFYYAGTWAASTNTPTLANTDTGVQGAVYYVTDAGSVDFGAGAISFAAGDKVANNGTTWDKWDMTDNVASVFGRTGAVVAVSGDYTASQVTNVPAGTIAATDVQAAINELDGDIQDHITDATDAHDASAISVVPAGNLGSTDVQAALEELQGDIDSLPTASAGDINETSFSLANNQAVAADVTGFAFAAATVRSFSALVSVEIDATADLYEQFTLQGINKAGSFNMSVDSVGDSSGVVFSITSAGQVQYTSGNAAGFVSGAIKFRAITTTV